MLQLQVKIVLIFLTKFLGLVAVHILNLLFIIQVILFTSLFVFPGIKNCEAKAKETCSRSPEEMCHSEKVCCTDCDCISTCVNASFEWLATFVSSELR